MKKRKQNAYRQKQINLLQVATRKRHSRKQMARWSFLLGTCMLSLLAVGLTTHVLITSFINQTLYQNPKYALKKVKIETPGEYSQRHILRAAGLRRGQNLWALDMGKIQKNIEQLPFVAEAQVEKHLPNKLIIKIKERTPIAKVMGLDDLGTRKEFYIDREQAVLFLPQSSERRLDLPEIHGLQDLELQPGQRLAEPKVKVALELLRRMETTSLGTALDFQTIDLRPPFALHFTTVNGVSIYFRLDYLPQQLQRLQDIMNHLQQHNQQLAWIDLTLDRNVPVRFVKNQPQSFK